METIVMKFGGAAVASTEQFGQIAEIILDRKRQARIVVVVSAMGDTTDQLFALARAVHPEPPLREQDMLVSVGERISIALLAMALHLKGEEAISFTGSQSGIITSSLHAEARIIDVRPHRLIKELEKNKVVIVAGFQGVSQLGEITTLGRGGSDTSAVALGVALDAKVEFYKDVAGIYAEDPKKNPKASFFSSLTYDQALAIVQESTGVLHPRSIKLARQNGLKLHVRSFFDPDLHQSPGTMIAMGESVSLIKPTYEEIS
jgi:aspartate kinase